MDGLEGERLRSSDVKHATMWGRGRAGPSYFFVTDFLNASHDSLRGLNPALVEPLICRVKDPDEPDDFHWAVLMRIKGANCSNVCTLDPVC